MKTEKKLQIIDDLIERAKQATYESRSDMSRCVEEAKSFIRKMMSEDEYWGKKVNSINWSPIAFFSGMSDDYYYQAWNGGKASFLRALETLKSELERYEDDELIKGTDDKRNLDSDKVFIVHGHDDGFKNEVARFIAQLELKPIVLHEQASSGTTIIEKIEQYSEVGFGVVLYTACDVGAMRDNKENLNSRARQNVIFEHGYLIGKLGRKRVTAIVKDDVEKPNDISGVVYINYASGDSWKSDLIKELKAVGYDIDANKLYVNL